VSERLVTRGRPDEITLTLDVLAGAFRDALCGPRYRDSPEVVWTDGGAQILLHVGKLQVRAIENAVIVAVDTESEEFGVAPLMTRFVFGEDKSPASLVAATDAQALGHPQVAARWGALFRDVVWAAFARLVEVEGKGKAPVGIEIGKDAMEISFQNFEPLPALAHTHLESRVASGLRLAPRSRPKT